MKKQWLVFTMLVSILYLPSLACSTFSKESGVNQSPGQTQPVGNTGAGDSNPVVTDFPLPKEIKGLQKTGQAVNFQTVMSIDQVVGFYREALASIGLKERKVTTTINEKAFSLVFDGAKNGQSVVLQGFKLEDYTNVSLRYEKVN